MEFCHFRGGVRCLSNTRNVIDEASMFYKFMCAMYARPCVWNMLQLAFLVC